MTQFVFGGGHVGPKDWIQIIPGEIRNAQVEILLGNLADRKVLVNECFP
jgi:hypothetical protein